ncbi:MAG: hypothetical protein ACYC1U_10675 [Candidatus Aquicultorales bacterium]
MEKLFELPIKVTREEIPEDFDSFRRYVMETSDGRLIVVGWQEPGDGAKEEAPADEHH